MTGVIAARLPSDMKAVRFHAHGGLEELRIETIARPDPGNDEVLVHVRALSLNGFDPMVLRGLPAVTSPLPMTPCSDCAGDIAMLGHRADHSRWHIGDKVSIIPLRPGQGMMGESLQGVAADYCVVPQESLLPLPSSVSYTEAACLPTAYGTAFRMMITRAKIKRGERVVIFGAAGGVGTCCVQLARLAGAEVIACAGTGRALQKLKALGADHVVDMSQENFLSKIIHHFGKPSIWGGGGADVVVNFLGGDTWPSSLAALGRRGRLVTCGASAGPAVEIDLRYVWSFEIEILGSNGWDRRDQQQLLDMVASKCLTPAIHSIRPLTEYREALQELINHEVIGKSVLTLNPEATHSS